MLKRIVQQVNGLITNLYMEVSTLVKEQLLNNVNKLRVSIIQPLLDAVSQLRNLLVQTMLSFKALLVSLITQAQSIKQGLINALRKAFQIGSQPPTTVAQTHQPALVQAKPKKKRAGKTK